MATICLIGASTFSCAPQEVESLEGGSAAPETQAPSAIEPAPAILPSLPLMGEDLERQTWIPSQLVFERGSVDLGEVSQHGIFELAYPFEVVGAESLKITELDSEVGITGVRIRPDWDPEFEGESWPLGRPIPAGSKGCVIAHFESGRYLRTKPSSITVCGDFEGGQVQLTSTAFVVAVFELEEVILQFGEVVFGGMTADSVEKVVRVEASSPFEILEWTRIPPGVEVSRLPEREILADGRVVAYFQVRLTSAMPSGRLSSSVIAKTSLGVDLEFLVNASVFGPVKYAPVSRVAFGIFEQGKARSRTVTLRAADRLRPIPVPTVELEGRAAEVMTFEWIPIENGQHYEIKLNIGDAAPAGSYNGVLRIVFPEDSGIAQKEIVLNARIRHPS